MPTYSYARVYFHGDGFIRHSDRGSCEVSVSIHVGRDGGEASLWFPPDTRVEMEEGDGAVYLGCETDHWRERFTGSAMGQLLLHYVVAGGIAARIVEHVSSHPIEPRSPLDPTLVEAGHRQRTALLAAVTARTGRWSKANRIVAAAMLDVLWSVASFERLVVDWQLDRTQAIRGMVWVIGVVEEAIRKGRRPS